ncbi:chromate efflux transporter [Rubritalea tangerina]|uniref:Chromate efflux transporter n=2 Tax=Rubritalea tangerina TaxID=430798 RepID=A0ABW4Z873_9BACT
MQFFSCFLTSLKLGLTSFGGPVAHLGYFRDTYVVKKGWVSEERFAELLALCQFLPGPASSQFGAAIGYDKGGWLGALGSWIGFTLPSAILMILLAVGLQPISEALGTGWIQGLKLAAVAIVALAVLGMKKKLCTLPAHYAVAVVALLILVFTSQAWIQPMVILLGGIVGALFFADYKDYQKEKNQVKRKWPVVSVLGIGLFIAGVCAIPWLSRIGAGAEATAGLLRAGALVFGGGHVVLPLLESSYVGGGLMDQDTFLAGYGAAQAVPGPMFTLASYLGSAVQIGGNAWLGGLIGTVAIFAPGMFLLAFGIPLWNWLKAMPRAKGAVVGANAAVVGLLGAALIHMFGYVVDADPKRCAINIAVVLALFLLHGFRKMPAWMAVLSAGVLGGFIF